MVAIMTTTLNKYIQWDIFKTASDGIGPLFGGAG
jgi:hypothetical protein